MKLRLARTVGPTRSRRRWYAGYPIAFAVALCLLAQVAQADPRSLRSPTVIDAANLPSFSGIHPVPLFQAAPPNPSGAEPPYPLNHTLDGNTTALGSVANADFEEEPTSGGSPPTNFDLEGAAVDVTSVTNGDFETGDYTGWTLTGSPIIQFDATHGYWARLGSNGQDIVSSAVTIPQVAQALVVDTYYQGTNSWAEFYVLSGPNFETSTQLLYNFCSNCGWRTEYIDLSSYRGQSVKFKLRARYSPVGFDAVRVQQVFPGYDSSGRFIRGTTGGDDHVILSQNAWLATDPFVLDAEAQTASVELKRNATNSQYNIAIATGPSFSTWNSVSSGLSPDGWQVVTFNVAAYAGQQVKVRVKSTYNWTYADDIIASQSVVVPSWTPSGTISRIEEGTNHYLYSNGSLTSDATVLPADVQNVTLELRSADGTSFVHVQILRGAGFSEVVELDYLSVTSWTTLRYGLSPYAGETVKLRVYAHTAGNPFHLDDAGLFESVLPGWQATSTDAIEVGEDGLGTFVRPWEANGAMFVRSSWISPAIVDVPGSTERRYYAVSYDLTSAGSNLMQVFWVDETGDSDTVFQDASSGPSGFRTSYFPVYDFMGTRGYFVIKITGGGKAYSIGDNIARQQLTEPFSRKVGLGIDTTTGTVTFADQDLAIPGSMPLSFTRYYNAHSDHLGTLGFRWSHTYDTHLVFADGDIGAVFGSGREEFFREANGLYYPVDPRIHSSLVAIGDGTYTLTTKDNLNYLFDAQGRLTAIEDLNGNALTFAYDGQGRLSSVDGDGAVALGFAYDANGRLSSVTDPAGSVYAFGYDAAGDLVSVTDPEGGVRSYAYSRHRLTTVTDEEGGLVVDNAYDEVNRVVSQTDSLDETILIAHDTPGKGATEVTFPDGGVAAFYFDLHHRTIATVDPSGRTTSFVYDGNGNLDKVIDSGDNQWDFAFDASADLSSLQDPLGNPVSFTYNAKHLPTSVTDARGNVTTFTYDVDGNMLSSTDPLGHVTTYTYDADGNLLTVTDSLNRTTTYNYSPRGLKTSQSDPLGNTWTYAYTSLGKLRTETDPLGNTTTYSYDLLGRIVGISDPLGRETTFLYDLVGHLLLVEDPAGNQTTWDYDERGLVEAKTDPAGKVTAYSYDADRRMTSVTNPVGETTGYGYDEAGRLVSVTDPLGNETTYAYDAEGRLASKVDPLGRQTLYAYDGSGRLAETTLPNGATVVYGYDPDGNLTSVTDELERVTTNAYDELSRLVATTDPLGNETTYGYNAAGLMTSVVDPLGNDTSYDYDDAGQMTSVADPLGNETTYGYDAAGRRVSVTDATNRATTYGYDAAGQLVSVTDPGGNATESAYDPAGRLASVTSPAGHVTAYVYNSRGLLISVTDPLLRVTSYTYDDAGRLLTETDPAAAVTTYGYDGAGRLSSITDDLGGVVAFGYDAASQLTSVTDANGETWDHGYNALGLRNSITDPLGRLTSFGYNAAGELTSRTDGRNITTGYGYDAAGRMTSVTFPGGSTGYAYDAAGRRTSMTDATGATSYTYDDAGRTTSVASPQGTIGYGYDTAGRRGSMTLPGAKTVTYAYNAAGLLGSLTDWRNDTTSFGYDADGNRTSISRPNGIDSTYTYDAAGQVTEITHAQGAQELLGFDYTYDAAGRPTSVVSTEGTESYTYDDLGRVTSVAYPGGPTDTYTYDPAGNRLSETEGGSTTNYTYDAAGQLLSVGSESYAYDEAGNLIQVGSDSYTWDHDSRLLSAEVGSHSATYTYDGDGVRVGADVDSQSSSFLVDGEAGLPTVVGDGTSAYVHAGGLLETAAGSTDTYALSDRLGSVRGLSDDAGALVGTASYEAFGSPRAQSGAQSLFGYAGEPSDATGLVYLRARSLDPETGRMLSADSVIPNAPGTQGYNPYAYASDNPTTWTDPTGHLLLDQQTVDKIFWEIVRGLEASGPAGVGGLLALVMSHPIIAAVVLAFVVLAAVLFYFLVVAPNKELSQECGAKSEEGVFSQVIADLLNAVETHPVTPEPPGTSTANCNAPPGTIGMYGALRGANEGHPECNAHHIIQHAAVRDVPGYDRDAAPAIVLIGPPNVPGTPHYNATQVQRAATVGGTYGAERVVAFAALRAAGVPPPVVTTAIAAADGYFVGQLRLTFDSPLRVPGDRWGYGG